MKRTNLAPTPARAARPALARTVAPIVAGAVVSWIVTSGLELAPEDQAALIIGLTAVLQAGYYSLVRAVEPHLPKWLVRLLLGSARTPTYPAGGES